jgi:hypothetical protein
MPDIDPPTLAIHGDRDASAPNDLTGPSTAGCFSAPSSASVKTGRSGFS